MHSAVWSQPTTGNRKFRAHTDSSESPDSTAGKVVLGIGITEVLLGGLLVVLGLTGFFVRDDNKRYLGVATVAGIVSVATGISGCRAVSSWDRAKACTNYFTFFSLVNAFSCLILAAMAIFIITSAPQLLLTSVIAFSEATLAAIGGVISVTGLLVSVMAREVLRNPLGGETRAGNALRKKNRPNSGDDGQ